PGVGRGRVVRGAAAAGVLAGAGAAGGDAAGPGAAAAPAGGACPCPRGLFGYPPGGAPAGGVGGPGAAAGPVDRGRRLALPAGHRAAGAATRALVDLAVA